MTIYRVPGIEPMYPGHPISPAGAAPVVPGWADLLYRAEGGDQRPPTPVVYPPSDPPPWITEPERPAGRPIILAVLVAMLVVVLGTVGFIVQRFDLLPASVPLIGRDSGVAACQVMAKGNGPTGERRTAEPTWTETEYRNIRGVFADSRHEAIRVNGVKMMDLGWQMQSMSADEGLGALAFVGSFADAYAGLAGGCAEVGYTLPALTTS